MTGWQLLLTGVWAPLSSSKQADRTVSFQVTNWGVLTAALVLCLMVPPTLQAANDFNTITANS